MPEIVILPAPPTTLPIGSLQKSPPPGGHSPGVTVMQFDSPIVQSVQLLLFEQRT